MVQRRRDAAQSPRERRNHGGSAAIDRQNAPWRGRSPGTRSPRQSPQVRPDAQRALAPRAVAARRVAKDGAGLPQSRRKLKLLPEPEWRSVVSRLGAGSDRPWRHGLHCRERSRGHPSCQLDVCSWIAKPFVAGLTSALRRVAWPKTTSGCTGRCTLSGRAQTSFPCLDQVLLPGVWSSERFSRQLKEPPSNAAVRRSTGRVLFLAKFTASNRCLHPNFSE